MENAVFVAQSWCWRKPVSPLLLAALAVVLISLVTTFGQPAARLLAELEIGESSAGAMWLQLQGGKREKESEKNEFEIFFVYKMLGDQ